MINIYLDSRNPNNDLGLIGQWANDQRFILPEPGYNRDADSWIFRFRNEHDAAHFKLVWGGVVIP